MAWTHLTFTETEREIIDVSQSFQKTFWPKKEEESSAVVKADILEAVVMINKNKSIENVHFDVIAFDVIRRSETSFLVKLKKRTLIIN